MDRQDSPAENGLPGKPVEAWHLPMNQQEEPLSPPLDVAVRSFYDRYPYPRPVDNLDQYRDLWQDRQRRRAEYHLLWPARSYREDHSILIAGCGTSQAAKHALRWPAAQVTGIDFSATSVSCTEELKRKYNLDNLQVRQLPIERVRELEMSFDQIVCTGVLHHLADPDAGLSALRNVLKPDGAMHLMVYAPYGRTGIYMLQEFCRRLGIHATDARDSRSHRCAQRVASRTSAGNASARGSRLSARGGTCRCSVASAGPCLFRPAIVRLYREGRADIRPLDKASALQRPMRCRRKDSPSRPNDTALPGGAVCGYRTVSRHHGSTQLGCIPKRQPQRLATDPLCR